MKTIQSLGFALLLAMSFVVGPRVALGQYQGYYIINGTSGHDDIDVVSRSDGGFRAWVNDVLVYNVSGGICAYGYTIDVRGLDGNDAIDIELLDNCDVTCKVNGGSGNDQIIISGCRDADAVGDVGDDNFHLGTPTRLYNGTADGGGGADWFCYYADAAVLKGGSGNDDFGLFELDNGCTEIHSGIVAGESGNDIFNGGEESSHNAIFSGGSGADEFYGGMFGGGYYSYISCDSSDSIFTWNYGTINGCSP